MAHLFASPPPINLLVIV